MQLELASSPEAVDENLLAQILTGTRAPLGFYRRRRHRQAVIRYLVEKILLRTDSDRWKILRVQDFKQYHLYGLLTTYYHGSPRRALEEAYQPELQFHNVFADPELILAQFFSKPTHEVPRNFWTKPENRIRTIRWFVEKHLQKTPEDIYHLSAQDFATAGLSGFLSHYFGCSPTQALRLAYPEAKPYRFARVDVQIWKTASYRQGALTDLGQNQKISFKELQQLSLTKLMKMGLKHSLVRHYRLQPQDLVMDLELLRAGLKT